MFDPIRRLVLRFAHLPPEPTPPAGAPGSVKVFRAAGNYYKLRVAGWCFAQIGAIVGIIVSLWFVNRLTDGVESFQRLNAENQQRPAEVSASEPGAEENQPPAKPKKKRHRRDIDDLARTVANWPHWAITLIHWAEYAAIVGFILQLPATFAAVRLEYEQHWYIVTDRSLRIRSGLFSLQESTMSFANLQQVEVKQGPLQRLLGLADVHLRSAGGGGGDEPKGKTGDSMHLAVFHGVDNADEIRDLILARLKRFREAGLGDPDERTAAKSGNTDALAAAQDLLAEVRKWRQDLRG
ncbi:MAG: hypothetical protein RIS54_903 [Verrucomicrobiota bacterium]|jgi:membrane protein YdbS with pleckstrin-like domain